VSRLSTASLVWTTNRGSRREVGRLVEMVPALPPSTRKATWPAWSSTWNSKAWKAVSAAFCESTTVSVPPLTQRYLKFPAVLAAS